MSHSSSEECCCICHTNKAVHITACCRACSLCHKNIRFECFDEHVERCEREVIDKITPRIQAAWCPETSSPGDMKRWTANNAAVGQCAVTACLIQALLGGELIRTVVEGFGSHYYNRLPSGRVVDLTASQFPPGTEIPEGEERSREYVLDSPGAANARSRERYELLKERYVVCHPKR